MNIEILVGLVSLVVILSMLIYRMYSTEKYIEQLHHKITEMDALLSLSRVDIKLLKIILDKQE